MQMGTERWERGGGVIGEGSLGMETERWEQGGRRGFLWGWRPGDGKGVAGGAAKTKCV